MLYSINNFADEWAKVQLGGASLQVSFILPGQTETSFQLPPTKIDGDGNASQADQVTHRLRRAALYVCVLGWNFAFENVLL